jgi:hypothetical protein
MASNGAYIGEGATHRLCGALQGDGGLAIQEATNLLIDADEILERVCQSTQPI